MPITKLNRTFGHELRTWMGPFMPISYNLNTHLRIIGAKSIHPYELMRTHRSDAARLQVLQHNHCKCDWVQQHKHCKCGWVNRYASNARQYKYRGMARHRLLWCAWLVVNGSWCLHKMEMYKSHKRLKLCRSASSKVEFMCKRYFGETICATTQGCVQWNVCLIQQVSMYMWLHKNLEVWIQFDPGPISSNHLRKGKAQRLSIMWMNATLKSDSPISVDPEVSRAKDPDIPFHHPRRR